MHRASGRDSLLTSVLLPMLTVRVVEQWLSQMTGEGMSVQGEEELGDAIHRLRSASGLTQKQLAASLGLSGTWLSKVERGVADKVPDLEQVSALEAALGVEPGTLRAFRPCTSRYREDATTPYEVISQNPRLGYVLDQLLAEVLLVSQEERVRRS
jgi:transcriptional regulator with XRE-family HTH domain